MTAAKSLGSTKSSSASSSKSRAADASLSSSSAMLILYEIMFVKSSVNSHQIYPIRPPRSTLNPLFPVKSASLTLPASGKTPTQAHLRPVPGKGTRDLPARPEVRNRDQHPPRGRDP